MSDLLKSAFGYFNNSSSLGTENDFVGQVVEIGNVKFVVKRVIAEGGFAFIYVVQDPNTAKEYALKRLLASDQETNNNILQEINILKKLSGHPNIIQYLAAAAIDKSESSHGKSEYLVLTEYCTKGNLVECLNTRTTAFPPDIVCRIFWQTCKAVQHLHTQLPPVIHRDLKMDNLLISADGIIKLCDFGSCTLKTLRPDPSWNAGQRSLLEDEMAKFTTPMYRPPEMVDTWNNHPIGPPCDIWALGCILYTLCFMSHPFSDSAKLKILNANYSIPTGDSKYAPFHDIIRGCLKVNPETRLTISDILERLAAISESMGYDMKEPLNIEVKKNEVSSNSHGPVAGQRAQNDQKPPRPQPSRPPPPQNAPVPPQRPEPPVTRDFTTARTEPTSHVKSQPTKQEAGLFSSLKGGAGSFFKNLKDTSNKVMQTVQQSIARSDLDISYITSRILVMPFPADGLELAYKSNHVEDVRAFLEARHPGGRYCVYNLSGRSYPPTRLGMGRVVDSPFGGFRRVPPLHILYNLCGDIMNFLERDQRNVAVIHCTDGKASSAVLIVSLLMYSGMMEKYEDALQMFAVKRIPPDLQPSESRYLNYLNYMLKNPPILPHSQPVTLVSLIMQPVPLFTKLRDGCRPYVELYQGDERIKSTLLDYDKMRVYHISEGKVMLPLNITVCGDITISVYHARQNLGGVMSSGRPTGHKICQFQFHTGFIQEDDTSVKFTKGDLDDIGEGDHYQDRFMTILNIFVCDYSKELRPMPWESSRKVNPEILFGSTLEMEETYENFVTKPSKPPKQAEKSAVPPPRPAKPPQQLPMTENKPKEEEVERLVDDMTQEADLLTINPAPDITNTTSMNRQESVDLLGLGFDSTSESNNINNFNNQTSGGISELDDLWKSGSNAPSSNVNNADLLIDPFGSENASAAESGFNADMWSNLMRPNVPMNAGGLPRNSSTPNLEQQNRDPFSEFGNLGQNLNIPISSSKPVTPMSGSPNVQSPVHRPTNQAFGVPQPAKTPGGSGYLSIPFQDEIFSGTPIHQAKSPMENRAPDYSRSHFDSAFNKKQSNDKGNKPTGDIFGDLLGSQGYEFASKKESGPRTMNELRHKDLVKELDPDRVKVLEWTEGKKGNIRALLCSINMVLWDDCKWKGVDMSQLVSSSDVKKAYRKACLAVHPDKQVGTPNENIAKLVFVELNNAWSDFENDTNQQNLFAT